MIYLISGSICTSRWWMGLGGHGLRIFLYFYTGWNLLRFWCFSGSTKERFWSRRWSYVSGWKRSFRYGFFTNYANKTWNFVNYIFPKIPNFFNIYKLHSFESFLISHNQPTQSHDQSFMSGSCHLDRALIVKIGVECQIFVIVTFFNCSWGLQFGAHSRYYKGALTQKRSFLVICTTFRYDFHVS